MPAASAAAYRGGGGGVAQVGAKQRYLMLEVSCTDEAGEDVETPTVRLRLR